jgi:hypothetical protein
MLEEGRLATIVEEIDARNLEDSDVLLVDLLCVCWPSTVAQAS